LCRRRSRRWVLVPSILGLSWFILSVKVIIPFFAKDAHLYQEGFIFSIYYRHLGHSMVEMLKTILFDPVTTLRYALMPRKIIYLLALFLPTAFICFLSPAVLLISLPIFMQNLLSAKGAHARIQFQYVAMLIPFIFGSLIFGFRKIMYNKRFYPYRFKLLAVFLFIMACSGVILKAPQFFIVRHFKDYRITDVDKRKHKMLNMIPRDASVIATFQFLSHLAHRSDIYSFHFVATGHKMYTNERYMPPENLEYALIDFYEPLLADSFYPPNAPSNIRLFLEEGRWGVINAFDYIVLFEKDSQRGVRLCEAVADPLIENRVYANIDNQVEFLGFNVIDEDKKEGIVHLVYYWRRIGAACDPLGFFIAFSDADDNVQFIKFHAFGYKVYIPAAWPEGQIVQENHYLLVPQDTPKPVVGMEAGLFMERKGLLLPVMKGIKLPWPYIVSEEPAGPEEKSP
jgi:hypothetical protein